MKEALDNLWLVQKKYKEQLQKLAQKQDLTIAEWELLRNIKKGAKTQKELVMTCSLDVSTLSRQLNKLLTKKMIYFQKVPGNFPNSKKKHFYSLTTKGESTITVLDENFQVFKKQVFKHWTLEEENMLKILLNCLVISLKRA